MTEILYAVIDKELLETHPPRLVIAGNRAQAIRHVASRFEAKPVSAKDAAKWVAAGVRVEQANGALVLE